MFPKISICVPIYGVEAYVARCATSLFEQSYKNIEFVFVNDCTKDQSMERLHKVIEKYPERIPFIKIIHHSCNRGLGAARNTAVSVATGDFLLWVDADDYVDLQLVEKVVCRQLETDADIVTFNYKEDFGNGNLLEKKQQYSLVLDDWKISVVSRKELTMIWRRLIRTSLYKENGIRVEEGVNMGEDFQVLPKLFFYARKIVGLDDCLYIYNRANENSYCSSFSEEKSKQSMRSAAVVEEFFSDKSENYKIAAREAVAKVYAMQARGAIRARNKCFYTSIKIKMVAESSEIVKRLPFHDKMMYWLKNYYAWMLVTLVIKKRGFN